MGRNKSLKSRLVSQSSTVFIPMSLVWCLKSGSTLELRKDPGVPRLPVLKQRTSFAARNAIRPNAKSTEGNDVNMATEPTLASLVDIEGARRLTEEDTCDQPTDSIEVAALQQRRRYIRTLYRVIEQSDVVVLVLDARDPNGCRSRLVEEEVRRRESDGKVLVYVLNKVDLVPRRIAEAWLKYLRHTAPTIAFRASTQQQRTNISSKTAPSLLNALKSFKAPSRTLTVGIVGYPNVGKSSLINSLKRAKVCAVAAEPGWTKEMQVIQLEKGVKLLDSPGVIFESESSELQNLLLRNVLKTDEILDPVAVVSLIYDRITPETLCHIYSLPMDSGMAPSVRELLVQLALSSGRLLKAGIPDIESTARSVIHDWNMHKLPFYSEPPPLHTSSLPGPTPDQQDIGDSTIVSGGFTKAFDLDGLWRPQDETEEIEDDSTIMESDDLLPCTTRKRPCSPASDEQPLADSPPELSGTLFKRQRKANELDTESSYEVSMMAESCPMSRANQRRDAKKDRKSAKRRTKLVMEVEPDPKPPLDTLIQ